MSKNISVEAHVKRYEQTELVDLLKLIKSLTELAENRKEETKNKLRNQLAILESGEIPAEEVKDAGPAKPRRTRGGKEIPQQEAEA